MIQPARTFLLLTTACILLACSFTAKAADLPDAPQPQASSAQPHQAVDTSTRWYYVIEPDEHAQPLTVNDKLLFPLHEEFRWTTPLDIIVSAAWGNWTDGNPHYGTNGKAFGKRAGVAALDELISRELTDSLLPIALHQDPRYYRQAYGTYESRVGHAIRRVLITQNDSGKPVINYSQLIGLGGAAALTQTYYPANSVHPSIVFTKWGTSILEDGALNIFDEFWPDVEQKLFDRGPNSRR